MALLSSSRVLTAIPNLVSKERALLARNPGFSRIDVIELGKEAEHYPRNSAYHCRKYPSYGIWVQGARVELP